MKQSVAATAAVVVVVLSGMAVVVSVASCGGKTGSASPPPDGAADSSTADRTTGSDTGSSAADAGADTTLRGGDAGKDASTDSGNGEDSSEGADTAIVNPPGCPPTLGASGPCPDGLECNYPHGECICATPCSGVPQPADAATWQCTTNASACPASPPKVGGPCPQAGLACNYPGCCTAVDFTCAGGAWDAAAAFCPP